MIGLAITIALLAVARAGAAADHRLRGSGEVERSICGNGNPRGAMLCRSHLENKPCEHYRVREYGKRPDGGDWIAAWMPRVHKPNANSQDNCADNPNPNLWEGEPVSFDRRVQTIEDAEQKQRHEAEQI